MAILVSTARTEFEKLKRDITDVSTGTFTSWCDYLNDFIYRKLSATDPERFILTQAYSSVSATPFQTSALPAAFKNISPEGTGFYIVERDRGFYISGTDVVFTEVDGEDILLRYIPNNTAIDALTDYFTVDTTSGGVEIIPDEYLNYVIKALDVFYTQWDETSGAESLADFRFTRVLNEIIDNIRKEPDAHQLNDFSQVF
jgi:hypothetical protein